MNKITLSILASAATIAFASPTLAASQIYNLAIADSAAGLGSGPFGTVSVTENAGSLLFIETLAAGYRIHKGNANHNAFSFSILGDPNVTVSNLTAGFAAIDTSPNSDVSSPPFGTFFTAIECTTACGPGFGGGFAGPLSFTLSSTGSLSLSSLGFNKINSNNIYFTSDLVNSNGMTGNVGATAGIGAVPEPTTWALMLIGFGAAGICLRRRKPVTLQAA